MAKENKSNIIIYQSENGQTHIEVQMDEDTVWLSQQQMADLYQTSRTNVVEHIKHIYEDGELVEESTCRKIRQVRQEGARMVEREIPHYNLDMIISLGYRINSIQATHFRQWATARLKEYIIKGFTMDDERLKQLGGGYYWKELLDRIRDIRSSEKVMYRQVLDIYATAVDYSVDSKTTKDFFATVQNKMHYAVHGSTAAEVIVQRADHTKDHMGLTSWKNAPNEKIVKADVSVVKNYLQQDELQELNEIVTMHLDYATRQARRHIPMTMQDWAEKLDAFLQFNDAEILKDKGKVTAAIAKAFAESEFEKYRVIQDRQYQSDFDRLMMEAESTKQ